MGGGGGTGEFYIECGMGMNSLQEGLGDKVYVSSMVDDGKSDVVECIWFGSGSDKGVTYDGKSDVVKCIRFGSGEWQRSDFDELW
ncbi:unnamed protein product, partial [Dovyalis caffra]